MSLFLPLTTDQYHAKPMAISSITSPVGVLRPGTAYTTNSPVAGSPSPSASNQSNTPPPPTSSKSGSSSPPSRTFSNYSRSSTSSFSSSPNVLKHKLIKQAQTPTYYHPYCNTAGTESETENAPGSLSLYERRLRNKTASAKYRAKKNQQYGEMRSMISSLTKENELLLRQLDHVQHENGHLKATCDRLRGKIMAQKMLKQYLDTEQPVTNSTSIDNNCFLHYHTVSSINHRKYPEINDKRD
ncbi:hypothetical protein EDC94DRAFT_628156 [Helicostylum pulchrum]|nr:hypothetical protein EDC94DRAFT_628156 [Helicostylum pulchrum]